MAGTNLAKFLNGLGSNTDIVNELHQIVYVPFFGMKTLP